MSTEGMQMVAFAKAKGTSRADPPLWSHAGSNPIELDGRRSRTAASGSDHVIGWVHRAGGGMVRVS